MPERASRLNRVGIEYARAGRIATAESLFIAALSLDPKHAGALTNLGNLRALDRHPEVALAYYEAADRTDPADPGVDLNRGAALLELGRDGEAEAVAADAVTRAGGIDAAERLLGLPETGDAVRAGQATDHELLRQLLLRAARRIPNASATIAADSTGKHRTEVVSKPAAARAAEAAPADLALYWHP